MGKNAGRIDPHQETKDLSIILTVLANGLVEDVMTGQEAEEMKAICLRALDELVRVQ